MTLSIISITDREIVYAQTFNLGMGNVIIRFYVYCGTIVTLGEGIPVCTDHWVTHG